MIETKLDPRSLTSEERALWDTLAIRKLATGTRAENAYARSRGALLDLLEARRAIFRETESGKVRLPKVREFLELMGLYYRTTDDAPQKARSQGSAWQEALAELDAEEGRNG